MGKATASSRDDFPMNAFALLPQSIVDDIGEPPTAPPVEIVSENQIDVVECDPQGDASAENPMMLLKLNLAHTELRETIETLYHVIDSQGREVAALRRENARLVASHEQTKFDAEKSIEKVREKLQAHSHETTQMQQKLRTFEAQKERVQAEVADLQLKLEERDSIIAALEATVVKLNNQEQRVRNTARHEAELQRLVEMWSSKERSVAENTDHVRKATTGVQRLAGQLQSQLKQAQLDLLSTEKEYGVFREYLAQHQCVEHVNSATAGQKDTSCHRELLDLRNRLCAIEQEKLEAITENQVLQTKCTEYTKSIRLLSSQLEQTRAKGAATQKLVIKYQESAADGTQTIAELQESLMKLCDQLTEERNEYSKRLNEQTRAALDSESRLQEELDGVQRKLKMASCELETGRDSATASRVGTCSRCGDDQELKDHPPTKVPEYEDVSRLLSPPPLTQKRSRTSQSHHIATSLPQAACPTIPANSDNTNGTDDVSERAACNIGEKRNYGQTLGGDVTKKQVVSCRLCNEEPFGFMVRCQKCKDPFHAGCVKKTGTGAKKRLGHIFKCSNCAPHRPTKVQRQGGGSDEFSKPNANEDERTQLQRPQIGSLVLTPSRTPNVATRPALR